MEQKRNIDTLASELAQGLSLDQLREKMQGGVVFNGERIEPTAEQLLNWKKHVAAISAPPDPVEPKIREFAPEKMGYAEARRKFWAVLQMRAAAIEVFTDKPFQWEFDEVEQGIIRDLLRYFTNDPECSRPLFKGVFLYGSVGTGKTEIMQAFQKFCENEGLAKAFEFTSMSATYSRAKTDKGFDPISENVTRDRLFDEFGRYSGAVLNFGESVDINEIIIEQRYERWKRYGQLSHFVANATPNDLGDMFSPMVYDRLKEMCFSVFLPGKSKRK